VAGDPADVGGAEVDVLFLQVEDHLGRGHRPEQIAGGRVQQPLRLAGRARRVQDVEGVLGVDRLGLDDLVLRLVHRLVPPDVAARPHRDPLQIHDAVDDQHVLDRRAPFERLVGVVLEWHDAAAAPAAVGGDDHLRLAVEDPVAQRLGAEPAEDDRVRRSDPGAGEHRDRQLRDHPEVDRDAVALLDAESLEGHGGLVDLAVELAVGEHPRIARLALPDDGGLVAPPRFGVAVDAVGGGVELAADEPFGPRHVPLENFVVRLDPIQLLGLLRPEGFRVPARPIVDGGIGDVRLSRELRARLVAAILLEER
jgi:hypothetical protein